MTNDIPRRVCSSMQCSAERAISNAMCEVEKIGADVLLTDAIFLLQQAKDKVSDYVDKCRACYLMLSDSVTFGDLPLTHTCSHFKNH